MSWKCCIKEPSETGKKVLCFLKGDIYVATRIKDYYIPIPFTDHFFSPELSKPELWHEIDFPEGFTGLFKIGLPLSWNNYKIMTYSKYEQDYPADFDKLAKDMINSMGTLKKNKIGKYG